MSGSGRPPAPGAPDPAGAAHRGVGAHEALVGFPLVVPPGSRPLERVRLAPVVAGALRAALDALAGDLPGRPPMRVSSDDAVFEVRLDRVDGAGVTAAGGVLEAVEANLVPAPHAPRQWIVRVPVLSPVESFLMIERDDLALALPWHAVSRVRMVRGRDLAAVAAQEGSAVVEGFGADPDREDEVPAVLVALGMRRAWLAVDRLVWRLPAAPDPASPAPPRAGLGPALLTAEGARYWLVELAALFRDVAYPPPPSFGPRAAEALPPAPAPVAEPEPALPVERATPEAPATVAPPAWTVAPPAAAAAALAAESVPVIIPSFEPGPRPKLELVMLTGAEVTPLDDATVASLGLEAAAPAPAPGAGAGDAGAPSEAAATPEPTASPLRPRVLVAEDSITARIFLRRLLEQLGFEVQEVTTLRELLAELGHGPWAIVMVDVELPDARGAGALAGIAAGPARGAAPVVALVRDAEDAAAARGAGVTHTLRKPFERDDLERLLLALGWGVGDA